MSNRDFCAAQRAVESAIQTDPALLHKIRLDHETRERSKLETPLPAGKETWPDPLPILAELPPVEPFCEDLLPASFRPLALDVSERMQVPLDFPAVVLVLCLAGMVNRRAVIQPKALDTAWTVVPNLWGGIIAPPGFMKSPVIQGGTPPLDP